MLGTEANQYMISFSLVLCGLHSCEPGTLSQAFKSSKGQELFSVCISWQLTRGEWAVKMEEQ